MVTGRLTFTLKDEMAECLISHLENAACSQGCGQSRFCCLQVWCEAEQGEEQGAVVFGVADGGGDAVITRPGG